MPDLPLVPGLLSTAGKKSKGCANSLQDGHEYESMSTKKNKVAPLETAPNKKMKKTIKPSYANALSLANTLEITNMTTFSTTPLLDQSIMHQDDDLSNKEKAELLFDKVRGLPCWSLIILRRMS
jgi:hypothetical protein